MFYSNRQLTTDYMTAEYGKQYDSYEYYSFDNNSGNQRFVVSHANGDIDYVFTSPIDGE